MLVLLRQFDRRLVMSQGFLRHIEKLGIYDRRFGRLSSVLKFQPNIDGVSLRRRSSELNDIYRRRNRLKLDFFVDDDRVASGR